MKIIKYAALAILVVTLCKKTNFINAMEIGLDGKIHESAGLTWYKQHGNQDHFVDTNLLLPLTTLTTDTDSAAIFVLDPAQLPKTTTGIYNADTKTATVLFTNVIERSQATTPPNVDNPDIVPFGVMINPKHNNDDILSGGRQTRITTLWGIPQTKDEDNGSSNTPNNRSTSINQISKDLKNYNKKTKTATMKDGTTYVGVVEYSKAVTPPNISIPALQLFATIKNSNYAKSTTRTSGSQKQYTTLWGLEVHGTNIPVKNSNNKTIGQFWPDANIAQLTNGQTIVMVIKQAQGNYKQHAAHALGPVWTWYQQPENSTNLNKYGITSTGSNYLAPLIDQDGFGTVTIHNQKYTLFGINLSAAGQAELSSQPQHVATLTSSAPKKKNAYQHLQHIDKETPMPGVDSLLDSKLTNSQAAGMLYPH